jgi:hypothetical protein
MEVNSRKAYRHRVKTAKDTLAPHEVKNIIVMARKAMMVERREEQRRRIGAGHLSVMGDKERAYRARGYAASSQESRRRAEQAQNRAGAEQSRRRAAKVS